jgi:glycosyltransferase involved in cell wall biosynthesis
MEKKKVLWLSDFNCATGLATVAHNIVEQLLKTGKYDFEVVGVNHLGEPYDFKKWPFPIYPARDLAKAGKNQWYDDPYGRPRFLELLSTGKYDIVVTLPDIFIMEVIAGRIREYKKKFKFQWIFYYAVDGIVKDSWINNSVLMADIPVAYTHFGKKETLRVNPDADPRVIYPGVNTNNFCPIKDITAFRKTYFGDNAGKFIVTNVNRNQPRKDIPRTIAAFAKFRQQRPESLLYLHMNPSDVGGDVREMAGYWGLQPNIDYMVPDHFNAYHGCPVEVLNKIYNASDVLISTTLGEGWGLTVTEAMAARTPVIIPDNTAFSEIGADGRARLVKSGQDFICLGAMDFSRYRPLTDFTDMVDALVDCHDNREQYKRMADNAYEWVRRNVSWDMIAPQWLEVFAFASK